MRFIKDLVELEGRTILKAEYLSNLSGFVSLKLDDGSVAVLGGEECTDLQVGFAFSDVDKRKLGIE